MNETDMSQITAVGCAALNEDQMHMEYLLTAQIKSVFFSPYILRRSFFFLSHWLSTKDLILCPPGEQPRAVSVWIR